MKVSVIVPVYNVEKYLNQCLSSLVGQSLEDLEILVVDDGSIDRSSEIIDEFATRYPEKIKAFHKENGGQGSARNLALEVAQGEFIGFVDSDDWVDSFFYQAMYEKAIMETADIVICDMIDHYSNHEVVHRPTEVSDKFKQTPSACNKLFRKDFIGTQRFMASLWYEDFNFTTKLLFKTEKISVCPNIFYHCHCRDISTMNNNNAPKNLDIITVFQDILNELDETDKIDQYQEVINQLLIDHILISAINRVAQQKHSSKNKVIKQLRQYVKSIRPNLKNSKSFCYLPFNRKIVALLNLYSLHIISKYILTVKQRLKK